MLIASKPPGSVKFVQDWADRAVKQAQRVRELGDSWTAPDESWTNSGRRVGEMFEPLGTVLVAESWKDTELDTVAAAMQSSSGSL